MGGGDRRQGQHRLQEEPLRPRQGDQVRHRLGQRSPGASPPTTRPSRRSIPTSTPTSRRSCRRPRSTPSCPPTSAPRRWTAASCCCRAPSSTSRRSTTRRASTRTGRRRPPTRRRPAPISPRPTPGRRSPRQAIFFAAPPDFYGTQFAGKEEAINGRFYEMLRGRGRRVPRRRAASPPSTPRPASRALDWFVDLYDAKAVPAGTTNYLWDDLGQGFASGTIAINLDWPGWAGFFNDPASSKVAGNVGVKVQPKGSVGHAHRLVRPPRLLGHRGLREQGGRGLAGLVPDQRGQPEARGRRRAAADPHRGLGMGHRAGQGRRLQDRGAHGLPGSGAARLPGAADRGVDRDLQRRLSRAAGRHPRRQDLAAGARRRRREGDRDPAGRRQRLSSAVPGRSARAGGRPPPITPAQGSR